MANGLACSNGMREDELHRIFFANYSGLSGCYCFTLHFLTTKRAFSFLNT